MSIAGTSLALAGFIAACVSGVPGAGRASSSISPSDSLLSERRLRTLPERERAAWLRYLTTSIEQRALDRDSMARELAALGRDRPTRAPYARASFDADGSESRLRSDSIRRVADIVLTFQTPSGGWSKHVDMTQRPRQPGESYYSESDSWTYIATIDNGATTSQMRFLAGVYEATADARYREAFRRGLEYLVRAQFPNGCWPQVYPLQGSYHDAATFNDDAAVNVLRVLRDITRGRIPWLTAADRERAVAALARGVDCIVAAQVIVEDRRTAWGQQHDPLTLVPVRARTYEPASLSGRESAGIAEFLMTLPEPNEMVVEAVHAAVDWFRATAISGYRYDFATGLQASPDAGPIWARMYEIGTNRPMFSNRDGVVRYDWNELTDRRTGYAWYGEEPRAVLERYERWAPRHPRPRLSGSREDA